MAQMSMSFVDTVMVGRLGSEYLAAAALGNSFFFTLMVVCLGILSGTSPMVSQAFGAGRGEDVRIAVRQALWLATLLAIVPMVLLRNSVPILVFLGQNESAAQQTDGYLDAITWGLFPFLWFGVLRNLVEGVSRPRVVTLITVTCLLVNIAANYVLMYGKFGLPALGLAGCGWASALVFWIMFCSLALFVLFDSDLRQFRVFSELEGPNRRSWAQLVRIGGPVGITHGLEMGLFSATAFLMGVLGVKVLAAHQIALQCAAYTFMIPMGLSIATSVRVGQAVGARDPKGAARAGLVGVALGAGFMLVAAMIFWLFPRTVIRLFIDIDLPANLPVVEMATVLLGVAATFQLFDGVQVTSMGALRGLKDTRIPMLIALVSYWVIGLPSGYFFAFKLDWHAPGLWWGLVLGLASAACLLAWRFKRQMVSLRMASEA
jgi:MATE family multidrug resistance protein